MFNFYVIPYKKLGRGAFRASTVCMSVLFLAASFFLAACTDEETVEVPGPTVTTTVPGPTVTVPSEIPSTDDADVLSGSNADDTIDGKGGDDMIEGGDGADTLMGGDGADEISGGIITEYTYALNDANPPVNVATAVTGCARGANAKSMDGNDVIRGGPGDDKLYGGSDDDMIYGEGGNDLVCGNSGSDMLDGGAGDDHLDGGAGDDTMVGGDGDDLVDYSSATKLSGGTVSGMAVNIDLSKPGSIIQDGFYGRDTISGIEKIKGTLLADTFTGDDSDNTFMPGGGADTLDGGAGSDTLDYSDATASATSTAAAGITISLVVDVDADSETSVSCATGTTDNPATETILTVATQNSTASGDTIRAPHTKDKDGATVCLSSIENVTGGAGGNTLTGDSQDNVLIGGAAVDTLTGNAGNDTLKGMGEGDTLAGGAGDDMIYGGAGGDTLTGGAGDDMLHGGAGDNSYTGGAGDDTVYVTDTTDVDQNGAGITEAENDGGDDTLSLAMYDPETAPTGTGNVFTAGLDGNVENLVGSKYNDSLTGNGLANNIMGGAGNDSIAGGEGNDTLDGGAGNDTLLGGGGNDVFVIMSGEGNDNLGDNDDQIVDTDKIQLKGFADGTTASYRALTGTPAGFVITVGNQSIQVATGLSEENLKKKVVTIE